MSRSARRDVIDLADRLNDPESDGPDIDALERSMDRLRHAEPELLGTEVLATRERGHAGGEARLRPTTDFAQLKLSDHGAVLLGGRMNLPGHPTVDYRRYELGVFTYSRAPLPAWFPRTDAGGPQFLTGALLDGTRGLRCPAVFALFSELVTPIDDDPSRQDLALLLAGRVERLFWDRAAEAARSLGLDVSAQPGDRLRIPA